MKKHNPFRYFKTSPEIIRLAAMIYVRFPLSLRNVEDLLHERGIDICHEGEVLEVFVSKCRDRKAALKFLKKIMKRYGKPREIVTDRLKLYRAAMKIIGNEAVQEVRRWKNIRCENSHLPFRRREQAMLKFRCLHSLQKFISIHSSVHNHFNHERH